MVQASDGQSQIHKFQGPACAEKRPKTLEPIGPTITVATLVTNLDENRTSNRSDLSKKSTRMKTWIILAFSTVAVLTVKVLQKIYILLL